ncbi:TolC family protein [Candidatus Sneabacter namystus]|nr:TolC family protein [Candidatus Sneabacter namystus]
MSFGLSDAYSLQEAMKEALKNNIQLKILHLDKKESDTSCAKAFTKFLPDIRIEKKWNKKESNEDIVSAITDLQRNQHAIWNNIRSFKTSLPGLQRSKDLENAPASENSVLSVRQNIFSGGADVLNLMSKDLEKKSVIYSLMDKSDDVLLDGINTYLNLCYARELNSLALKKYNIAVQLLKFTQKRFELGNETRTNLAYAQVNLLKAESEKEKILSDLQAYEMSFENFFGISAKCKLEIPTFNKLEEESLNTVIEVVMRENNLIRSSNTKIKALKASNVSNIAHLFPSIDLLTSFFKDTDKKTKWKKDWVVSVNIPIFTSGGYQLLEAREARRATKRANLENALQKQNVTQSAAVTWQEYMSSKYLLSADLKAVEASQLMLQSTLQELSLGKISLIEAYKAEQQLQESKLEHMKSEMSHLKSRYKLMKICGRLTECIEGVTQKFETPSKQNSFNKKRPHSAKRARKHKAILDKQCAR